MSARRRHDDRLADAVLRGDVQGLMALGRPDLAGVAAAIAALAVAQDRPVLPNAALAALLRHRSLPTDQRRQPMIIEWLGGLSLAAKVGLASAVTVASLGVTGTTGALPDAVQDDFDAVLSIVAPFAAPGSDATDTGIEVPAVAPTEAGRPTDEPARPTSPPTGRPMQSATDHPTDVPSSDPTHRPTDGDDRSGGHDEGTDDDTKAPSRDATTPRGEHRPTGAGPGGRSSDSSDADPDDDSAGADPDGDERSDDDRSDHDGSGEASDDDRSDDSDPGDDAGRDGAEPSDG
jgi:hypothetical protein